MRLFVVLLSSFVAVVAAWSDCCRDRDKDHRSRENCTALGLTGIPPGFDPTTQVLLFPKNQFSSLSWSTFQVFTRIFELDFQGNKILELTPSVTPILPTLSVLRLGSNRLKSLPDGSFSACPALTKLYLDNNAMDSLSNHTFSGLSKLEILDLSSNRIKVLPELTLHPLPAIETIYLEYNQITVMPDDWFSPKEEVPYLFLSANPWACYCSLSYFHEYLHEFELNVYVRVENVINNDAESVICASPPGLKNQPVQGLNKADLCPTATESGLTSDQPDMTTATPDTTPNPTTTTAITTNPPTPAPAPTTTPTTTPTTPAPAPTTTPTPTTPAPTTTPTTPTTPTPALTTTPTTPTPALTPTPTTPTPALTTTPTTPAVVTSTTPKRWVVTTTAATLTPSLAAAAAGGRVRGAAAFCFWLFAGGLLLCALSAACLLATLARTIVLYRRVYRPLRATLARRRGDEEAVRLLTYNREGAGGGVMALYRSVLFVHREGGGAMEKGGGGGEGEGRLLVTLEPTGGRGGAATEGGGEGRGREEKGVYRKTLYRLSSKEEEVQGWRDVVEECRVSAEEGGRRRGEEASGGVSRKRYSVILREEREEAGTGREELDWVVGGWEVKRGGGGGDEGEGPRSSFGEWLAHYLPSMPWGVTTPPESEAAL